MKLKKFLAVIMMVMTLLNITTYATDDEDILVEPEVNAEAYLLIDMYTGNVLAGENADAKIYPASTTKLLTAAIVLQMCELDEMVEVTSEAIYSLEYGASTSGLIIGEEMSVHDMLYCLLLPSGNDAANALAYHVGNGSYDDFIALMNVTATKLGAYDTHFVNPSGLHDDEHYTTASDMAIIAQYAYQNEFIQEVLMTAQKTLEPTNKKPDGTKVYTTNMLIFRVSDERYYEYSLGGKTGYTGSAGNCLVSFAEKDDRMLLGLVFNAEKNELGENMVFAESKELFEWGFAAFKNVSMLDVLKPLYEIPVTLSADNDYVSLTPKNTLQGLVPIDFDEAYLDYVFDVPESLVAPVEKGSTLGSVEVFYDGISYGTTDLLALSDVELSDVLYYVDKIENFFDSEEFYWILGGLIFILFICAIDRRRRIIKQRKRLKRRRQGHYPQRRR